MRTVRFLPAECSVTVDDGTTILDAARKAGVDIPASCGGKGLCGKCRVLVMSGTVAASVGHEHALSPVELKAGWRLACVATVTDDLIIQTQAAPARTHILTEFKGRDITPDGRFRVVPVTVDPPSLQDQRCDMRRIADAAGFVELPQASVEVLRDVPRCLRESNWSINLVMVDHMMLGILPGGADARVYGVGIDIGTTTIAGVLVDMVTGENLATASRTNPQSIHGDDVVSRIEYVGTDTTRLLEMRSLVTDAINEIIMECAQKVGASARAIAGVALAGNTTMHHLLIGIPPTHIGTSPFIPVLNDAILLRAGDIGIEIAHGARAYVLPNISAYVGGDITAGIMVHGIHREERNILYIDVGTNGEMALRANGKTYSCSTAAGPAFEGARISCGMRAATGAVTSVERGVDDIILTTVDDAPVRGLCGTGVLDVVAVMLDYGIVDETGRIVDDDELPDDLPDAVRKRVLYDGDEPSFALCFGDGVQQLQVTVTQRDVRELQLAKGAIGAGVEVMLQAADLEVDALDAVWLAGAFGSYMRPASARRVGLLPEDIDLAKVDFVGNAALAGARAALLDIGCRGDADVVAHETAYLELSGRADFQMAYMTAMAFPEA